MFRSRRRAVVYPQAEHARLSAAIAAAWGNEEFRPPPLPPDSFVRGVALHDRGYGELDTDEIGAVPSERWVEVQRRGFDPRGEDAVVDLVVALHVRRLVAGSRDAHEAAALVEMNGVLPRLQAAAGVGDAEAAATDSVTALCDVVSFDVCLEEPSRRVLSVVPAVGAEPVEVRFAYDGDGLVTLEPWPLAPPSLTAVLTGYRADGYPRELDPVISPVRLQPD